MEQGFFTGLAIPITMGLIFAQGLIMFIDEFYYHKQRGLGLFEYRGHVVDSLIFLATLSIPVLTLPSQTTLIIYITMAIISTLIITKDEWVHARECKAGEHWLHALLFVLHAPILIGLGFIWVNDPTALILRLVPPIVGAWAIYQFFYWRTHHAQQIS